MSSTEALVNAMNSEEEDFWDIKQNKELLNIGDLHDLTEDEIDNITVHIKKIAKREPKITRKMMSKYELAATITKLANYLSTLSSLDRYVKECKLTRLVNNAELAFNLLISGKFDATLDRLGYEQVSFSALRINPLWIDMLKKYFERNREAIDRVCYKPYAKALEEDNKLIKYK